MGTFTFVRLEKTTPSFKQKIHFPFHWLPLKVFLFERASPSQPLPPRCARRGRAGGFAKAWLLHR